MEIWKSKFRKSVWADYLLIIIGTTLMSVAIKCIFDPINLVTGGVSGIAIVVRGLTENIIKGGIPLWLTNIILNVPLFLISIKIKGWHFVKKTAVATVWMSIALYILPEIHLMTEDMVLASIFGGVITGVGIGMVFLARATTGGTDMLAAVIQHYLKHYSIAQILQVLDGAIVILGAFVFGLNKALYAIISIFLVSKISDSLIEGLKFSKLAYIISDKYQEIAQIVMDEMERGATGLKATGMYSKADKKVLFCVVSKKEIVQLKEIVHTIDSEAFLIVSDVREVFGEGFIENNKYTK